MGQPCITIQRHDPRWKGVTPLVRQAARAVLKAESVQMASLTLVLSNDAAVQVLNAQYRGKDKPTNVLSFPDGDADENGVEQLGDCIFAYETIVAEAQAQGKPLPAHLAHLVMHGVLHLLGYDHETEAQAAVMEGQEIALLAAMGIANPYETMG